MAKLPLFVIATLTSDASEYLSSGNYVDVDKNTLYGFYPSKIGDPTLGWETTARPHDLRRTARSYMAKLDINPTIAGKVLNHTERGVSAVYDRHDYLKEKTEALNKWADELLRIIN